MATRCHEELSLVLLVVIIVIVAVVLVILIRKRSNRKRYGGRNRIGEIDTSVPFRDVRNSDLSNNHINTRQTDSVFYHQSHHGDLTAGNNRDDMRDRQDSRYVSAGSIYMSRNIDEYLRHRHLDVHDEHSSEQKFGKSTEKR